jgi:hypothetical protein
MAPPTVNEIEVTVLGPGFGESIVVHVGMNEWIIVDSCWDSHSGRPAALAYLDSIGVDPATNVKIILATHWHDDHIGGISDLLTACTGASFCCSSALARAEFLEIAQLFNKNPILRSSGMSEIQRAFQLLQKRGIPPQFALPDRPVFTRVDASQPRCQLTTLSPSDAEFNRFLQMIASFAPHKGTTKFRCPDLNPNDLSVAAWLNIDAVDSLLGADLEEHGSSARGWSAVIASRNRPVGRALFFKIAHHGSVTGHHDGIWTADRWAAPLRQSATTQAVGTAVTAARHITVVAEVGIYPVGRPAAPRGGAFYSLSIEYSDGELNDPVNGSQKVHLRSYVGAVDQQSGRPNFVAPQIEATPGDTVRISLKNNCPRMQAARAMVVHRIARIASTGPICTLTVCG